MNTDAIFGKPKKKRRKKATVRQLPELERIQQVIDRLRLLSDILTNDLELRELDEEQIATLKGQRQGHANAISLLEQVQKRGELWVGGYLDNVGVVYADQAQEHFEYQESVKQQIANN